MRIAPPVAATAVVVLFACGDGGPGMSTHPAEPEFAVARGGADECVADADHVVSDQAELLAALAAASPGDVIALDGPIELTEIAFVDTAGVTITCASPGSGLRGAGAEAPWSLLFVRAPDVTIAGVDLNAGPFVYTVYAVNLSNGVSAADRARITGNRIAGAPLFLVGVSGAVVADNRVELTEVQSGIHVQRGLRPDGGENPTDGLRIERNTVVATAPTGSPIFGAIRARDGSGVVIADNIVRGPWSNGIAVAELTESRIERNRVAAARQFGVFLSSNPFTPISTAAVLLRANRLTAAEAGVFLQRGCRNVIVGNVFRGDADWGAVFDVSTGANAFLGRGDVVLDNGDLDCDGDGIADPNRITGGRKASGGSIGEIVREVIPTVSGRIRLH